MGEAIRHYRTPINVAEAEPETETTTQEAIVADGYAVYGRPPGWKRTIHLGSFANRLDAQRWIRHKRSGGFTHLHATPERSMAAKRLARKQATRKRSARKAARTRARKIADAPAWMGYTPEQKAKAKRYLAEHPPLSG